MCDASTTPRSPQIHNAKESPLLSNFTTSWLYAHSYQGRNPCWIFIGFNLSKYDTIKGKVIWLLTCKRNNRMTRFRLDWTCHITMTCLTLVRDKILWLRWGCLKSIIKYDNLYICIIFKILYKFLIYLYIYLYNFNIFMYLLYLYYFLYYIIFLLY